MDNKKTIDFSLENFVREHYTDRNTWLEARRKVPGSCGASSASTCLGVNPWESIDTLYNVAIGIEEPQDLSANASVNFGVNAEPLIRELVKLHLEDKYSVEHYPYDILRMKKKPWIFATLDGELTSWEDGRKGILEIKTGSFRNDKGLEEWENGVPLHYFAQACQQLLVTGWDYVIFAAMVKKDAWLEEDQGLPQVKWYYRYIDRKDLDVQASIKAVEASADAFHQCVVEGKRPPTRITYAI